MDPLKSLLKYYPFMEDIDLHQQYQLRLLLIHRAFHFGENGDGPKGTDILEPALQNPDDYADGADTS